LLSNLTLVIPTCRRPDSLRRLLDFLERKKVDCRILVLDSGEPAAVARNRAAIAAAKLAIEHVEYAVDIQPSEKLRLGSGRISTPFATLCEDNDFVLPAGLQACLQKLRHDPLAAAVQGHCLIFQDGPNGQFDLMDARSAVPGIKGKNPLARLVEKFRFHQEIDYGLYRTDVLRDLLDREVGVESRLGRALISSALTAIAGNILNVDQFSHTRNIGSPAGNDREHALECFARDAAGVFVEYASCRGMLRDAILSRSDNRYDAASIEHVLDLIHLTYLTTSAPPDVVRFMMEQELVGVPFATYWSDDRVQIPLQDAGVADQPRRSAITRLIGSMGGPIRAKVSDRSGHLFANTNVRRGDRYYRIHQGFADWCNNRYGSNARAAAETMMVQLDLFALDGAKPARMTTA